jgi:hypothetical protein
MQEKISPFEKPDLGLILEELELDQLEYHESDRPFYTACCPLHDDRRPSFTAYMDTQRCHCHSCHPEYMDVIDLWKLVKNRSFNQTVKDICTPITVEDYLIKELRKKKLVYVDVPLLAMRVRQIWSRLDFIEARSVCLTVLSLLEQGKIMQLDSTLRRAGV